MSVVFLYKDAFSLGAAPEPIKDTESWHEAFLSKSGIHVPETRRRGFAAECRRQSLSLRDDPIGRLDDETLLAVNRALAVFLGFA